MAPSFKYIFTSFLVLMVFLHCLRFAVMNSLSKTKLTLTSGISEPLLPKCSVYRCAPPCLALSCPLIPFLFNSFSQVGIVAGPGLALRSPLLCSPGFLRICVNFLLSFLYKLYILYFSLLSLLLFIINLQKYDP